MRKVGSRLMTLSRTTAARLHRFSTVAVRRSRARGQGLVEYGLAVAVIAVAALGAVQLFGGGIAALFNRLLTHFAGLA